MLPEVRRYDLPGGRGIVGVMPTAPATIVDGGAEGLAGLAAFGALPQAHPILYAGDLTTNELRRYAARGSDLVVTDSNRRRRFIPEYARQNLGATLRETEPLDENFALIDPFPDRGSDSQTVAALEGARYLRSPYEGGLLEFPEHAPIAAFDGDLSTTWVADRYFLPKERWLEVGFDRPRDVPYVDLVPTRDPFGIEREVDVNGVRARLGPGTTRVPVRLADVEKLRITITKVDQPPGNLRGGGGFREIRIPGVSIRQRLRPPLILGRALANRDLSRSGLSYVFERTTADDPFERDRDPGSPQLELAANREDAERQIQRVVFVPSARSYDVDAWVQPSIDAPDSALDRLVGSGGTARFDSSGRFHDQARYRASKAFDSLPGTAWVGIWAPPSAPRPWISWRSEEPVRVASLRLEGVPGQVRRPTVVRVSWPGGASPSLRVGADGTVTLPRPVRARAFRLTVLAARLPSGSPSDAPRAVGIASVTGAGVPSVSPPAAGPVRAACGSVRIDAGGQAVALRPRGTVADLEAGRPLRASGCGRELRLGAGIQEIQSRPGPFAVDWLRLRSPAPVALPPTAGGGRVVDAGSLGKTSVDGVRVELDGRSWLVLGQSFSKGWEATCDGRSLGKPRPVNGYANGWLAPADCRNVAFAFGPQRSVRIAYVVSAVTCLMLLAFLVVALVRGNWRTAAEEQRGALPEAPTRGLPLPQAIGVALLATLPIAFLFAARSSVVIWPVLTLILWRGVGVRVLTAIAAGLLGVAVPALYVIQSPRNRGGYNFDYSTDVIWAHWVTVAAIILLMVVCWRTLAAARSGAPRAGPRPPRARRQAAAARARSGVGKGS